MTDLPKSDAKKSLEMWALAHFEKASSEEVMKMLADLAVLVDKEFAGCSSKNEEIIHQEFECREGGLDKIDNEYREKIIEIRRQRIALYGILVGGLKTALANQGMSSGALNDLFSDLINLNRGVPGVTAFDIPGKSKVIDHSNLWLRAQVIAALDLYPDRKQEILKRSANLLDMTEAAIEKMVDNFKNSREPRPDLTNLVETVKRVSPSFLDDLLP